MTGALETCFYLGTHEVAWLARTDAPLFVSHRRNACSLLYGAAWRVARAKGYRRLVTYTLAVEPGTSLRAAGWRCVAEVRPQSWHRPNCGRPRVDLHPLQTKLRWEVS